MKTEDGYEIPEMTKKEADESVEEMGKMMDWFDGTCEYCEKKRMCCDQECFDNQARGRGNGI